MRLRRLSYVVAVVAVLAGCSPAAEPPAAPTSQAPATSPSPAPEVTPPSPPVGNRPVVSCLNGTYRLTRITDVNPRAAYARTTGGDVELSFSGEEFPDGNYVGTAYALRAAGKRTAALVTPDGTTSTLLASVRAAGSYTLEDSRATFVRRAGRGSGRLTTGGMTTKLDLAAVQEIVAPTGLLTVSCTKTTLWLTGDTIQYELTAA